MRFESLCDYEDSCLIFLLFLTDEAPCHDDQDKNDALILEDRGVPICVKYPQALMPHSPGLPLLSCLLLSYYDTNSIEIQI